MGLEEDLSGIQDEGTFDEFAFQEDPRQLREVRPFEDFVRIGYRTLVDPTATANDVNFYVRFPTTPAILREMMLKMQDVARRIDAQRADLEARETYRKLFQRVGRLYHRCITAFEDQHSDPKNPT